MIAGFTLGSVRSVSDLLADLSACRQLRHLSAEQREKVAVTAFANRDRVLFVRLWEAFRDAFLAHGYCCDICGDVTAISADRGRYAADRALDNLDGLMKLCLCRFCSRKFSVFAFRHFGVEVRARYSADLERIMLAYIAAEILSTTKRIANGQSPSARDGRSYRGDVAPINDNETNPGGDGLPHGNYSKIPESFLSLGGIAL